MAEWGEMQTHEIDGVTVIVRQRMDRRVRLGASEYIIDVRIDGTLAHSERHPWNVWWGHAGGQLLLPEIVERAKRRAAI